MNETVPASAFPELFIKDTPLLDVRAPGEFARGAFPGAINLPLLDDEQRRSIGVRYRQAGQQAAIDLGHELVAGELKESRLQQWRDFISANPDALLYCFRGGLRSQVVQEWLAAENSSIPRIAGGYKALRRFLLRTLEDLPGRQSFIVLAGKTGCAKTHLLQQCPAWIDLEGHANHRGSAFGPRLGGQPVQIDFENRIAIALLKLMRPEPAHIFIEDESRAIGSLSVPMPLHKVMGRAPLAVIEEDLERRVDTILNDYISSNYRDMQRVNGSEQALALFRDYLTDSLGKIQRRLGGERYGEISTMLNSALTEQETSGTLDQHRHWIRRLLTDYYDPMYDYQLNKKLSRIVFRGNRREFLAWAKQLDNK